MYIFKGIINSLMGRPEPQKPVIVHLKPAEECEESPPTYKVTKPQTAELGCQADQTIYNRSRRSLNRAEREQRMQQAYSQNSDNMNMEIESRPNSNSRADQSIGNSERVAAVANFRTQKQKRSAENLEQEATIPVTNRISDQRKKSENINEGRGKEEREEEESLGLGKHMREFIDQTEKAKKDLDNIEDLSKRLSQLRTTCEQAKIDTQTVQRIRRVNGHDNADETDGQISQQVEASFKKYIKIYLECKYAYQIQHPAVSLKQFEQIFYKIWRANENMNNVEVVKHAHILESLTYRNLKTLQLGNWLNDQVINAYIRLLKQAYGTAETTIVNSHFATTLVNKQERELNRVVKKLELTPSTVTIVPINQDNVHWYFVVVSVKGILIYDSIRKDPQLYMQHLLPRKFLKFCQDFYGLEDVVPTVVEEYPEQKNGYDCGVFMLRGMKSVIKGENGLGFDQLDISYLRISIVAELLRGQVNTSNSDRKNINLSE